MRLKNIIYGCVLFSIIFGNYVFAANPTAIEPVIAPKPPEILRSYKILRPGTLCSAPNSEEFMFSIEGEGVTFGFYVLKPNSVAQLDEYSDGSIKINLSVVLKTDTSKEYEIKINASDKTVGFLRNGFSPATNYCANMNSDNWSFYNTFGMAVIGRNGNAGQYVFFQSPQANMHTVQLGMGANTWQSSLGSGLWFDNANTNNGVATVKGDLQMSLTEIQNCLKNICVPFSIAKNNQ